MLKRKLYYIGLIIASLLSSVDPCFGATEHFEKGDLIFRSARWLWGHVSVYCIWDSNMDPEERESHSIVEAPGGDKGVWKAPYSNFWRTITEDGRQYWGGGTFRPTGLRAEQRQGVVDFVSKKIGYPYALRRGYKDRTFRTYRCDGLAEHAYETVCGGGGIGIVIDNNWTELKPRLQREAMVAAKGIPPTISKIVITPAPKITKVSIISLERSPSNVRKFLMGLAVQELEEWNFGYL